MRARALGAVAIVAVVALDRAAKALVLADFDATASAPAPLTPFLDLALRWNRGISFSLFAQESAAGRWLLLALTAIVTALIALWLWRARAPLVGLGLGLIIGGESATATTASSMARWSTPWICTPSVAISSSSISPTRRSISAWRC